MSNNIHKLRLDEVNILRKNDFKKSLRLSNFETITLEELFEGVGARHSLKGLDYSRAKTQEEKDNIFFGGHKLPYDKCRMATREDYIAYLNTLKIEQINNKNIRINYINNNWEGGMLIFDNINILSEKDITWMKKIILLSDKNKPPMINNREVINNYFVPVYTAGKVNTTGIDIYLDTLPDNISIKNIMLKKILNERELLREKIGSSIRYNNTREYKERIGFYKNNGSFLDDFEIAKYGRRNILISDLVNKKIDRNEFTTQLYNFLKFSLAWEKYFIINKDNPDKAWILKEEQKIIDKEKDFILKMEEDMLF